MESKRKYFFWEEISESEAKRGGFERLKNVSVQGYAIAKLTNNPVRVCIPADNNQKLLGASYLMVNPEEEFKLRTAFETFGFRIETIIIEDEAHEMFVYNGKDHVLPEHELKKRLADQVLQMMTGNQAATVPSESMTYSSGAFVNDMFDIDFQEDIEDDDYYGDDYDDEGDENP